MWKPATVAVHTRDWSLINFSKKTPALHYTFQHRTASCGVLTALLCCNPCHGLRSQYSDSLATGQPSWLCNGANVLGSVTLGRIHKYVTMRMLSYNWKLLALIDASLYFTKENLINSFLNKARLICVATGSCLWDPSSFGIISYTNLHFGHPISSKWS